MGAWQASKADLAASPHRRARFKRWEPTYIVNTNLTYPFSPPAAKKSNGNKFYKILCKITNCVGILHYNRSIIINRWVFPFDNSDPGGPMTAKSTPLWGVGRPIPLPWASLTPLTDFPDEARKILHEIHHDFPQVCSELAHHARTQTDVVS